MEIDTWRENNRRGASPRHEPRPQADTTLPASLSIAVLPFASLGAEPDNEYFADGLTEEITTRLAKLASLHVTSRTSSARLKGTDKDAAAIARELRVRYLLEGSVRRAGGRLRVAAQLPCIRVEDKVAESHLHNGFNAPSTSRAQQVARDRDAL